MMETATQINATPAIRRPVAGDVPSGLKSEQKNDQDKKPTNRRLTNQGENLVNSLWPFVISPEIVSSWSLTRYLQILCTTRISALPLTRHITSSNTA
jgi:hypothetical protein